MISNFAHCSVPFLADLYSNDFILEMFLVGYANIFGFYGLCLQVYKFVTLSVYFILFYAVILVLFPLIAWLKLGKGKGKAIPLQAWICPEGSMRFTLPDLKIIGT